MQAWTQFYAVIGAAAAALLGLLFVSVSMHVGATLGAGRHNSKLLAEQAFSNYVTVIMVSLLALIPQMTTKSYGFLVLCLTVVSSAWVLVRLYLTITQPASRESRLLALRRHFSSLLGFGMMLTAAVRMVMNYGNALNLFATATIVLLVSATMVSWELLMRIAKSSHSGPES